MYKYSAEYECKFHGNLQFVTDEEFIRISLITVAGAEMSYKLMAFAHRWFKI